MTSSSLYVPRPSEFNTDTLESIWWKSYVTDALADFGHHNITREAYIGSEIVEVMSGWDRLSYRLVIHIEQSM